MSLGFWQLDRSKQKQAFLDQQQLLENSPQLAVDASLQDDITDIKFRRISLSGRYDEQHQFLLDNQHVNGKVGYFIMTPFLLSGSRKAILVNRGWLPMNKDRRVLPKLSEPLVTSQVLGRVNSFPGVGIRLTGADKPTETWPAVVGLVDQEKLAKSLGYPLYSFQIELDPEQAEGFLREWRSPVRITPEKHLAYAFQWFGLAFTLVVLFVWITLKHQPNE